MKKKLLFILSFIIAFVCIFTLSQSAEEASVFSLPAANAAVVAEGSIGENITWVLDDTTLTVSGTGAIPDYSSGTVPWYKYRTLINSLVVENGITRIGEYAFFAIQMTEVSLPDTLEEIGISAFESCDFTEIRLPDSLKSIEEDAFHGCKLNGEVTIPASMQILSPKAFTLCESLAAFAVSPENEYFSSENGVIYNKNKSVLILYPYGNEANTFETPEYVKTIGSNAFNGNKHITSVSLSDNVTSVEDLAFGFCASLEYVDMGKNVTKIGEYAFVDCSSLSELKLSENLISIGEMAFLGCSLLNNITLPDKLQTIGSRAFSDCKGASTITIPASVQEIDIGAFSRISELRELVVDDGNEYYCSVDGVLYDKSKETLVAYPSGKTEESFTVPETVAAIKGYAFSGIAYLKHIEVAARISEISSDSFGYCTSLESVVLPDSVTKIQYSAFCHSTALKSINIPESVTQIGFQAFYGCKALEYVAVMNDACVIGAANAIPENAVIKGHKDSSAEAFAEENNREFTVITDSGTFGDGGRWMFDENGYLDIFGNGEIPDVNFPQYTPWYNYRKEIVSINIGSGITAVGEYAFYGSTSLTQVNMCDGITEIRANAFNGCKSLVEILLPDSVTSIGRNVFEGCTALETFNIPASLSALGNNVFEECYSLSEFTVSEGNLYFSVTDGIVYNKNMTTLVAFPPAKQVSVYEMPASVTAVGNNAVYGNQYITSVIMSENLSSIAQYGFFGCENLSSITFNNKLYSLGQYCFSECVLLEEVILPESVKRMNSGVFSKCISLRYVKIPSGITVIPSDCFEDCAALEQIEWPESIKEIGRYAFYGCDSLKTITLPDSLQTIGLRAFMECDGLTDINISVNVSDIGDEIFFECRKLERITVDENNEYFSAIDGVLYDKSCQTLLIYPAGKKDEMFVVPETVSTFRSGAFEYAILLECIYLSENITEIPEYCFYYCEALESIYIPECVLQIGNNAFWGCKNLHSLVIPEGVENFAVEMLHFCESLESLIVLNPDCVIENMDSFADVDYTVVGYSESTAQAYAEKSGCLFISINDTLQSPADWSFNEGVLTVGCNYIPELKENEVFLWYCYSWMTDAIVLDGVTEVSENAFKNFSDSTVVVINGQNIEIKDGAFANCQKLMSIISFADISVNKEAVTNNEVSIKLLLDGAKDVSGNLNAVKFSRDGSVVKFDSAVTVSYYDFFNIVSALCYMYSDTEITQLYFPEFGTTDFGFQYNFGNEGWIPVTSYKNILIYPIIDVNYETIEITYNELCEKVASGEIMQFILLATSGDEFIGRAEGDNKEPEEDNSILGQFQKVLRAIITFFNKILRMFIKK